MTAPGVDRTSGAAPGVGATPGAAREVALAAAALDAARAALDRWEAALRARRRDTSPATGEPEGDLHRWFGMATGRLEAADCILAAARAEIADERELAAVARQAADLVDATATELLRPAADALGDDGAGLAEATAAVIALRGRAGTESDDALHRELAAARLG